MFMQREMVKREEEGEKMRHWNTGRSHGLDLYLFIFVFLWLYLYWIFWTDIYLYVYIFLLKILCLCLVFASCFAIMIARQRGKHILYQLPAISKSEAQRFEVSTKFSSENGRELMLIIHVLILAGLWSSHQSTHTCLFSLKLSKVVLTFFYMKNLKICINWNMFIKNIISSLQTSRACWNLDGLYGI